MFLENKSKISVALKDCRISKCDLDFELIHSCSIIAIHNPILVRRP